MLGTVQLLSPTACIVADFSRYIQYLCVYADLCCVYGKEQHKHVTELPCKHFGHIYLEITAF